MRPGAVRGREHVQYHDDDRQCDQQGYAYREHREWVDAGRFHRWTCRTAGACFLSGMGFTGGDFSKNDCMTKPL
jgi:hypothetical protein